MIGGLYWMWLAARVVPLSASAASTYLILGCVLLGGLLVPRSIMWFLNAAGSRLRLHQRAGEARSMYPFGSERRVIRPLHLNPAQER